MDRSKLIYNTNYGKTADIYKLPLGTKFTVNNGGWDGEIIEVDGKKCMHIIDTGKKIELEEDYDYALVISDVEQGDYEDEKALVRMEMNYPLTEDQRDALEISIGCMYASIASLQARIRRAEAKIKSDSAMELENGVFYKRYTNEIEACNSNIKEARKSIEIVKQMLG